MTSDCYVYALIDPINKAPFYVGKGSGDRMYAHEKGHANYNDRKLSTIKNIKMLGHEVAYHKLEENLSNRDALSSERFWIDVFRSKFPTTMTNGIQQPPDRAGCVLSEGHKQRLREVNKGKVLSKEHRQKIGAANAHKPTFEGVAEFPKTSTEKNVRGKNPRAISVRVGDLVFDCKKDAREYFGVSRSTFEKRYPYQLV